MTDAAIYRNDPRADRVAAAKRKLDTIAFRNGLITRQQWDATMRATPAQLLAERDANRKRDEADLKALAGRRAELANRLLQEVKTEAAASRR